MTRTQLIETIAEQSEVNKKVAKTMLDTLAQTATNGEEEWLIRTAGHWPIGPCRPKGADGAEPATGESIKIAARKVVKFRVAKAAKDAIVPPKANKAKA